jgi:hypothetical protein
LAEKVDKAKERQRIRDIYEPGIKALQKHQTKVATQIDHLKIQKIFLDSNVESLNEIAEAFPTTLSLKEEEFSSSSSLKGNYMKSIESEVEAIIGHGKNLQVRNSSLEAQRVQTTLNKKIEELQADLTSTITDINNTNFLFQQALNSIV